MQEKNDFQAFIFLFKEQVLLVKCAGNEFFISLTLIGFFFIWRMIGFEINLHQSLTPDFRRSDNSASFWQSEINKINGSLYDNRHFNVVSKIHILSYTFFKPNQNLFCLFLMSLLISIIYFVYYLYMFIWCLQSVVIALVSTKYLY